MPRIKMQALAAILAALGLALSSAVITADPAHATGESIQLIEVGTLAGTDETDDFVAIQNVSGIGSVSIAGWTFVSVSSSGVQTTVYTVGSRTLTPGATFFLGGANYTCGADDYLGSGGVAPRLGGVRLRNASGVVQDKVGFSSGAGGEGNPETLLPMPNSNPILSHHKVSETGDDDTDWEHAARTCS